MLQKLIVLAAVIAAIAVNSVPAFAITDGAADGNGHPYVGLMVAKDANDTPLWRCSGTLLSPTVFLTAGHCTAAPAASAVLYFDQGPIPFGSWDRLGPCGSATGYPCTGDATGSVHTHPDYNRAAFFLRDLGVVVLDAPMTMTTYGRLPPPDSLDALKVGRKTTFTAVGYGLQQSFPDAAGWKDVAYRTRMYATPHLVQINGGIVGDFSLLLSNNANTGGTCFGDSGGPNFLGDTNIVAGVTSFGLNGTCGGTGGVFRMDRSWSLSFLAGFGVHP